MSLVFLECEKALSDDDFIHIENKLKIQIPQPIKSHYLKFNGGYPNKSLFTDVDEVLELEIMDFMPFLYAKEFEDDPMFTLEGRTLEHWRLGELPTYLLPFAMDWGGNYIAYHLSDDKIYHYIRDDWSDKISCESNFIKNSQLIANGFEAFLYALQENPFDDRV